MQSNYPAEFDREQGFSEADWLRCLPGAVRGAPIDLTSPGQARVALREGTLTLCWQVLPPRQIGLVRFVRLAVHYHFDGVVDDERQAFMKHFDLYMQRGGG
ncbi:MAG: hypothetical protein JNL87_05410 [Burkholderiaceae bacterium]|nr:hypothetical protein [Burkholderiaceae bacterium]